jgi:photosystem II stability/assembly factor-like uncharacterized protein
MSRKTALAAALIAALLAAPSGASVQVGSSGWQWANPLPQGNTLRTMSFAGTTGYAAGDFGTLLKTTDGGSTWSGLPVGTFEGLTVVQALDAATVIAGGGCVARRSVDGGATFTAIAFTAVESGCRVGLRDLGFVTKDVGFLLLDDGSVFFTDDGGTQFAPRTAVPETNAAGGFASPGAIAFLDARRGYVTSGGKIFQTLDGGVSWRRVADVGRAINELWFADATHGFAVGNDGLVLRSDDGGATWAGKDLGAGGPSYTAIRCSGTQSCVLTAAGGTLLVRTTDAGDTPGTVVTPATDPIHAAAFASPTRVVAGGANGATVVSDDAGVTFAPIGGRLSGRYFSIRAGGEDGTALAPGAGGALAKTTDGGRTWVTANVTTSADLIDVAFPSAEVGYALDRDGGLRRTANGGTSWKILGTGSTRNPRAVLAPDASVVLVVGPRGVRRSADAGETFEQVRARAVLRAPLTGATATRGGALFAWGPTALVRSLDDGRSWTALAKPGRTARERRRLRIVQVSFATARVGLLRDGFGQVWRTTNAGRGWTLLTGVGTTSVTGMAAGSARSAYLITDATSGRSGGYLLRTEDGGATWQPQRVVSAPIRPAGLATSAGVDYLLAGDASLLFSTTGGVAGSPSELTIATKRRRLTRAGRITVTGRLRPAGAGQVTVSERAPGATGWSHQTVPVASNGTFVTAWRVQRGTTTYVAQWDGDFQSAGAGSRAMTVTVRPRRHR